MSAQWSGTATEAAARPPSLPAGAVAQANASLSLPATVSPAAVQSPAQASPASMDVKPVLMSNGSIAPAALTTPPPAPSAVPPKPPAPVPMATVNQNGKRELSPDRTGGQPPQKTIKSHHGEDVKAPSPAAAPVPSPAPAPIPASIPRPVAAVAASPMPMPAPAASSSEQPKPMVNLLPMGKGQGIDLRAEEEAARRVARSAVGGAKFAGSGSRAKQTDLFGEQVLRQRLHRIAQEHGMVVDDEAMRYLAMAAEVRVRSLLGSAIRAQQHRVHSTHQHKPPMHAGSGSRAARPLWSQKITSDTSAVMAALTNANREENKAHRVARTERNARETELARAQAAAKEREREREGVGSAPDTSAASPAGQASDADESAGPSRPAQEKPTEPVFQAAPTFGGPPPAPKKSGKGKKGGKPDMSAEVQAKMTNATAIMSAGRKRYAWEMGGSGGAFRPQVPSLLSGKRKKGGEDGEGEKGAAAEPSKDAEAPKEEAPPPPPKKVKRTVSAPHRRPIDVDTRGDKRARDDTALTIADVVFALEHEGSGRGMGTADEIVRRVWARPGGPYGRW